MLPGQWPSRIPGSSSTASASAIRAGIGGCGSRSPWRVVVALVVGAVALVAGRGGGWRPPSGVGGFSGCSYGERVRGRAARASMALHVAVIPATRQPARGALFYLEGGPGGAATAAAVSVDEVFAKVSEYRDLVLVDQRGTGGSQRVACPQQHVRATDADAVASYLRRCFAHLGAAAEQLSTATAAADLERVRRSLGYGRVDIYGSSYGATLAQSYLRRYPGSVRTATLDGASLPGCARSTSSRPATPSARCGNGRSLRCPERVPAGVPGHAGRAGPGARATPGQRPTTLATTIAVLLRSPEDAARVPLLVHEAAAGHAAPLAREYASHVGGELDARSRLRDGLGTILCGESLGALRRCRDRASRAAGASSRTRRLRARVLFRPGLRAPSRTSSERQTATRGRQSCPCCCWQVTPTRRIPPANLAGWRAAFPERPAPHRARAGPRRDRLRLPAARRRALRRRRHARGLDAGCARPRAVAALRAQLAECAARAGRVTRPACGRAPGSRVPPRRRGRRPQPRRAAPRAPRRRRRRASA